jgi:hypothetical protein
MMFILLFNFSISIVTGLSIYKTAGAVSPPSDMDVHGYSSVSAIMDLIGWDLFYSFIGGAIAGVFVAYGLKVPGDSAFVYSTFSTFYVVKARSAVQIFWAIGNNDSISYTGQLAILFGCVIFTFVVMVALLSFLMQLVKGPWSGME